MQWEVLSFIGTIAFAASGAIVAMEEEYDLLGVLVLGFVTAFGGGVVRNLLIGIPVVTLWEQGTYFKVALVWILFLFLLPHKWISRWKSCEVFFDAIGLAAFAIQGALYASEMGRPISAVIVAAVMTGIGGGIIRDVLAGRKPLVLRREIYAVWAMLAAVIVHYGWPKDAMSMSVLVMIIVALRMCSIYFGWRLPYRSLKPGS
ncbi:trimeric intracellular cation channel family protein [Paenibacillus sp. y28]|uniref:trimeric intracellular cation channel family protein n=1 Tax=Paenibacillus sp. y28 TaxID=3129110 RepID=UPI00301721FF